QSRAGLGRARVLHRNQDGAGGRVTAYPAFLRVVDSHTEGEPTRVVIEGWPAPAGRTMSERRADRRRQFAHLRSAAVCEPRGHDALVGALLTTPVTPGSAAGVVF